MKLLILAGLAAVSAPALAQTAPSTTDQQMSTPAPTTDQQMATPAPATDGRMPAQSAMPSSDPAMASSGNAAMPADGSYPKCSRTVKDHCTENATRSGARKHTTPRG